MNNQIRQSISLYTGYAVSSFSNKTHLRDLTTGPLFSLIHYVEEEFGANIPKDIYQYIFTVGDLIKVVKEYGGKPKTEVGQNKDSKVVESSPRIQNSDVTAGVHSVRKAEQEFVALIRELHSKSALTDKKYKVLRMAGERLNIKGDRRVELVNSFLQQQ